LFVREQGAIDNAAFRDINVIDPLAASQQLAKLRQLGLLAQGGKGSATYYLPGPVFPTCHTTPTCVPDNLEAQPDNLEAQPDNLEAQPDNLFAGLPDQLAQMLPQLGQRPPSEQVRKLVLRLCAHQAYTAEQLAALLGGRNKKYLMSHYLMAMLNEGWIERRYPSVKNHPHQAYFISDKGRQLLAEADS
jgi:ATP-dependent DNA helicase RecG